MATQFCPRCGTTRTGDFRFCAKCGLDFEAAPKPDPEYKIVPARPEPASRWSYPAPPPTHASEPRSGIEQLLIVGIVGAILVALLVLFSNQLPALTPADQARATASPVQTVYPMAPPTGATATPVVPPVAFAPIDLAGSGAKVAKFTIPENAAAIAIISHTGASNFAVWSIAADGSENDLLVNEIGRYSGTVLFDKRTGQHSVAFKIEASAPWKVTIKSMADGPTWDRTAPLSGTGDSVYGIAPRTSGLTTLDLTHKGKSNFAVVAYSAASADLLVNEIGAYTGQVLLREGSFLLEITADGAWTAKIG